MANGGGWSVFRARGARWQDTGHRRRARSFGLGRLGHVSGDQVFEAGSGNSGGAGRLGPFDLGDGGRLRAGGRARGIAVAWVGQFAGFFQGDLGA